MRSLSRFVVPLLVVFVLMDLVLAILYFFPKTATEVTNLLPKTQPGSCLILEEKYCRNGEKFMIQGKTPAMGFKVPVNTPIFAPFEGARTASTFYTDYKKGEEGLPAFRIANKGGTERAYVIVSHNIQRKVLLVQKGEELMKTSNSQLLTSYKHNIIFILYDSENRP